MVWLEGIIIFLVFVICINSILVNKRTKQIFQNQHRNIKEVNELIAQEKQEMIGVIQDLKRQNIKQLNMAMESINQMVEEYNIKLCTVSDKTKQQLSMVLFENTKQNKELYENMLASHTSTYTSMVKQHSEVIQQVTNNVIKEVETNVNEISVELGKRINFYIEQENLEIQKWIKTIQSYHSNHALAIEFLESALNKYPSSRELIKEYCLHIKKLITSDKSSIRKQAIERYNRAARIYLDNCLHQDWNYAKEIMDEALKIGNEYINDIEKQRYKKENNMILQLEQKASLLKTGVKLSEAEIDEIEKLDQMVDKNFVNQHKILMERYISVSQRFMRFFSNIQDDDTAIKEYNLKALKSIHEAHSNFKLNEKIYKQGIDINKIVKLLGGWDMSILHPSTQIYFQSVYSDLFAKLNPDVKSNFTEKILKMEKKEIS
jgi:hypothetical protein